MGLGPHEGILTWDLQAQETEDITLPPSLCDIQGSGQLAESGHHVAPRKKLPGGIKEPWLWGSLQSLWGLVQPIQWPEMSKHIVSLREQPEVRFSL